jgi:hypothetical protein
LSPCKRNDNWGYFGGGVFFEGVFKDANIGLSYDTILLERCLGKAF